MIFAVFAFSACDGEDDNDDGNGEEDKDDGETDGENGGGNDSGGQTGGFALDKSELSIQLGKSETLNVSGVPSGKTLVWESDNPSVVMVGNFGKVSALGIGEATVTVTVKGTQLSATCKVTVLPIYLTEVTVNKTSLSLNVGKSESLTVTLAPNNATDKRIKWESSDTSVATVINGTVSAKKAGSAVITATAMDGSGKSASCTVTVEELTVTNVSVNKNALNIDVGDSQTLTARVYPTDAVNGTLSWTSSNPGVISVDQSGRVTALKAGSATVTATAGGKSASCTVTASVATISYKANELTTPITLPDADTYKDGIRVIYWQANAAKKMDLGGKQDLSMFDAISFKVYSEKATGNNVHIRFSYADDDKSGTAMAPYFRLPITVDFTGWKEFKVDFKDMKQNYSPNWTRIAYVSFDCSGWDLSPNPNTKLYFGDIKMIKYDYDVTVKGNKTETQYLSAIKTSWKEAYTGKGGTSDAYRSRIRTIESNALKFWKTNSQSYAYTFNGTGTDKKGTLFGVAPGMDWNGAASVQDLYWRIQAMALGYATKGTSCYKNAELLTAIRNSLEYMYNNYYGEQHITDFNYVNWVRNSNWWYWQIGTASYVVDILMILSDTLTQAEINKYLIPVDFFVPRVSLTACNRLWIGKVYFASAVLKGETGKALFAIDELNEIFDYVTEGDGFYTDGSFIQHNNHPYTGSYGGSLLEELSDFMAIVTNTPFSFKSEVSAPYYDWIFDSFRPLMYDSNFMSMVRGRDIVRANRSENTRFLNIFSYILITSQFAPEEEQARLLPLIKYFIEVNGVDKFVGAVQIKYIDLLYEIAADETIVADDDYEIVKVFGNMDRVVQHRPKYAVGIALSSTRIYKYEAINGENGKGWYNGDGTVYIYTDGTDFDDKYFNNSDPLKRPGTTVTDTERVNENLSGGIFGASDFAGGVEHGKYGASALVLGYAQNNYYNTDITAKKSYFLFDNEIVCIGSGIKESQSGDETYTTVENRMWKDGQIFKVDGVSVNEQGSKVAKYMSFTGMGGYVFDGATEVKYNKYVNTYSFLEITVSHGISPTDGSYFYVYLPSATDAQTKAYSDSLSERITVISQTNAVHAVRDNDIGVTGYVFYEAGSCNGITVSAPCIVMVSEENGTTTVSVSDPTHKLESVTVNVGGSALVFNTAGLCGATVTKTK